MRRKLFALAVLVAVGVAALAVGVGAIGASSTNATGYLTADAAVGDVTDEVAATGALAAATTYAVAFGSAPYLVDQAEGAPTSDVTWPVTDVAVEPGDAVGTGQVLATADAAAARRAYERAAAERETANLRLAIAKEQLADSEDADDVDAERQARLEVYAAQNQYSQATEARDAARAALRAATIRSPIDGTVTEVNVTAGFDAPAGAAIVIASRTLTVTTDVVESDIADVDVGQGASVTLDAIGTIAAGTVSAISPVAGDAASGVVAYPVTVTLDEVPSGAKPGMSADVSITIATATGVVTVPSAALQGTSGDYAVMTLGADGNPQRVPVEVGLLTDATAEITSGLEPGTPVVIGTTADLIGTNGGGFGGGGVGLPGGVVRRIDGAGRGPANAAD